jgi:hypothetical protein
MDVWTTEAPLPTASTAPTTTASIAPTNPFSPKEDIVSENCLHPCLDKGVHLTLADELRAGKPVVLFIMRGEW